MSVSQANKYSSNDHITGFLQMHFFLSLHKFKLVTKPKKTEFRSYKWNTMFAFYLKLLKWLTNYGNCC